MATSSARLHVVTNDDVVARAGFNDIASAIMKACGGNVAMHLRMKYATADTLALHARALAAIAKDHGSCFFVNGSAAVAREVGADGVHFPEGREIASAPGLIIGASAHSTAGASRAEAAGADFVFLGTIWPSSTHPGECTAGVELISRTSERVSCPIHAIGGVTPRRAQEAVLAGAYGVAVISGVWDADEPAAAALEYLEAIQAVT